MHSFDVRPQAGQRLPLMVLVARGPAIVVVEGTAGYVDAREHLRSLAPEMFKRR